MEATVLRMSPTEFPEKWEKSEDTYTGNDLIDAYLKGREIGRDEENKIMREKLHDNIFQATQVSEKLLQEVSEKKFNFYAIHLKADNISTFTALFVVDFRDYLSDEFREVYLLANELKKKIHKENFNIYFSFTHNSPNPSDESLAADGFFLKYEKEQRNPESRASQ